MSQAVTPINAYNNTQNFYPSNDKWEYKLLPIAASVAIDDGSLIAVQIVSNTTTGNYTKMGVENAAGADFTGILAQKIASSDSDYATAGKLKGVWVPVCESAEAYFKVGAGTFTAVDVGKTVEIHSDSKSLAVDTAGKGARIMSFISSTRGTCAFTLPTTETA